MPTSHRSRTPSKKVRPRRGRRRYSAGEWFLAALGVAFLALIVVLIVGAFIGG